MKKQTKKNEKEAKMRMDQRKESRESKDSKENEQFRDCLKRGSMLKNCQNDTIQFRVKHQSKTDTNENWTVADWNTAIAHSHPSSSFRPKRSTVWESTKESTCARIQSDPRLRTIDCLKRCARVRIVICLPHKLLMSSCDEVSFLVS